MEPGDGIKELSGRVYDLSGKVGELTGKFDAWMSRPSPPPQYNVCPIGKRVETWASVMTQDISEVRAEIAGVDKRLGVLERADDVRKGVLLVSRRVLTGVGAITLIALTTLAAVARDWVLQAIGWGKP